MIVTVEPKNEAGNNISTRTYSPGTDLLMEQHQMKKSARYNSYRIFALGFLATVFLLLIICANVQMAFAANRQLTPEELVELCPDEKEFCYATALLGNCFGKSVKTKLLAKQCKCSCESAHHRRIQNCCRTVGDRDMNFCLPLCGYNTSVNELGSGLGLKCVSQLTTWAYCAGDANDNTKCCRGKGVEDECLSFCKGDVPTCDMQSIFSYQPCLVNLKKILECQMENLDNKPRFDPEWRPECDWERKEDGNGELPAGMDFWCFGRPPNSPLNLLNSYLRRIGLIEAYNTALTDRPLGYFNCNVIFAPPGYRPFGTRTFGTLDISHIARTLNDSDSIKYYQSIPLVELSKNPQKVCAGNHYEESYELPKVGQNALTFVFFEFVLIIY